MCDRSIKIFFFLFLNLYLLVLLLSIDLCWKYLTTIFLIYILDIYLQMFVFYAEFRLWQAKFHIHRKVRFHTCIKYPNSKRRYQDNIKVEDI
jgi:hypothetical protein